MIRDGVGWGGVGWGGVGWDGVGSKLTTGWQHVKLKTFLYYKAIVIVGDRIKRECNGCSGTSTPYL